jgi:hypothetical protein
VTEDLAAQYTFKSTALSGNFFDVGHLEVKIFCAKGLYAADLVSSRKSGANPTIFFKFTAMYNASVVVNREFLNRRKIFFI